MKKRSLIFSAIILIALVIYFRPLSFPDIFQNADSDAFSVTKTDLLFENGKADMKNTGYSIQEGSPEAIAIQEILDCYTYRRSLRTPFSNGDLSGNGAGYWLHLWGPNIDFNSGGTGEITMGNRVYRMGLFGNQKNVAFMEEIAAVLADAEPLWTS